jgi:hypothetical protein
MARDVTFGQDFGTFGNFGTKSNFCSQWQKI